jgi:hypothetical protein
MKLIFNQKLKIEKLKCQLALAERDLVKMQNQALLKYFKK